jgi:hypothetical protein
MEKKEVFKHGLFKQIIVAFNLFNLKAIIINEIITGKTLKIRSKLTHAVIYG